LNGLVILIFILYLFAACNKTKESNQKEISENGLEERKENSGLNKKDLKTGKLKNYFFDPAVSEVEGVVKVEMHYGPPNYGETPATDTKENPFILYLDNPINVLQTSDSSDFDFTTNGVTKFQLVPKDPNSLKSLINKKVKVTGIFFGKHTGHHYTDVLMDLEKVEPL
jgi:hypothetical protein